MSILIKKGTMVTIDERERVIENGAVYIENNRISDVDTVMVDGNILMENRYIKVANEEEISEKSQDMAMKIAEKIKQKIRTH